MNVLANVAGLAANQAGGLAQRVLGGGGGGGGLLGGPLVNAKAHTKAVCKDNDLNVHVNPNLQIAARATLNPHLQFGETPIGTYTVPAIVGLLAFFGCLLAAAFVMAGFYPRAFWTASGSVVALVAAAWLGLSHPKDRPIAAHFSNMMMVTGALYVALTSIARAKTTHPPGLLAGLVLVGVAGGLALALGKAAASQPQAAAEGFGPLAYQGAGAYGQGSAGASEAQRCEISPDWKYRVLRIRKTPHADGTVVREVEKKDLVGMTFYVEPGHTGFFKLIKLRYSTGVEEPLNGWIIKTYDGCQTLVLGAGAYGQGSAGASGGQRREISPDWKYEVLRIRKTPNANGTVVREVQKKDLAGMTFYVEPGHTGFFKLIKLRYSTGVEEPLNGWIIKTYDGCQTLVPGVSPERKVASAPGWLSPFQAETLRTLRLERAANSGAGDCQFHAVAIAVGEDCDQVRQNAIKVMRVNPDVFDQPLRADMGKDAEQRFLPETPFDEILEHFSQRGTWGNHATLKALAVHYKRDIVVIRDDSVHREVPELSELPVERSAEPIYVLHYGAAHYEGTRRA